MCSGRTNCLVFINNIYLMPVTQTQTDRAGEGVGGWMVEIKRDTEKSRRALRRKNSKIEANELRVKCYACPRSPSLSTTLISISASPKPDDVIRTAAAQYIPQCTPRSHSSSLTAKTNHTNRRRHRHRHQSHLHTASAPQIQQTFRICSYLTQTALMHINGHYFTCRYKTRKNTTPLHSYLPDWNKKMCCD